MDELKLSSPGYFWWMNQVVDVSFKKAFKYSFPFSVWTKNKTSTHMQFALYNLIHHPLKHRLCPCMLSHSRKNIIIIIIIISIILRPGWNTSAHHFLLDFLVDPSGVFKHLNAYWSNNQPREMACFAANLGGISSLKSLPKCHARTRWPLGWGWTWRRLVMSTSPCREESGLSIYTSQLEGAGTFNYILLQVNSSLLTQPPIRPIRRIGPGILNRLSKSVKKSTHPYQISSFLKKKELWRGQWISISISSIFTNVCPRVHQGLDDLNNFIETQTARVIFIMGVKHFLFFKQEKSEASPAMRFKSIFTLNWLL